MYHVSGTSFIGEVIFSSTMTLHELTPNNTNIVLVQISLNAFCFRWQKCFKLREPYCFVKFIFPLWIMHRSIKIMLTGNEIDHDIISWYHILCIRSENIIKTGCDLFNGDMRTSEYRSCEGDYHLVPFFTRGSAWFRLIRDYIISEASCLTGWGFAWAKWFLVFLTHV